MTVILDALPQSIESQRRRSVAELMGGASIYFSGVERTEIDDHTAKALLEMEWEHPGE